MGGNFVKNKVAYLSIAIIIIIAVTTIYSATTFYEGFQLRKKDVAFERAKVLQVVSENLNEDRTISGLFLGHQNIELEVLTGEHTGTIMTIRNPMGRMYNVHAKEGMEIIVSIYGDNGVIESLRVYTYQRSHVIYFLLGLFFIVLIGIGRLNGLKSIASLTFTGIMIIGFLIPSVIRGMNPIIAAIITVALSATVTFYLISGWTKKCFTAILGTVIGVSVAGTISYWAGKLAYLSGITMEKSEQLMYIADETDLQVKGLMFAAILIASLGAIMDVGMSMSSSIFELNSVNNKLTKKQLFTSGMNVGKDIIGTMANTLILAFTGGLLNIIIIFMAYKMPYHQLVNLDIISIEIIQALAGSIGIVLTVPITTAIATLMVKK